MDRRRFVKSAGWGAAGCLLSPVTSRGQADLARSESPVLPQTAWGQVWLRWTAPALPKESLHAHGLVIPWGAEPALIESARNQGYQIYAEVTPGKASESAKSAHALGLSGIVLQMADGEQQTNEKIAAGIRLANPNLTIVSPDPAAKQPAMLGSTVISQGGILQVSSATEQPWIDSNLAMVGFNRALRPTETPLISFQWTLPDALQQQLGPGIESYLLAVAEAGALHSDLILNLHPTLQNALVNGSEQGRAAWKRIANYMQFYLCENQRPVTLHANVGVLTNSYDDSYEAMNLMARHNILFRVLSPTHLAPQDLRSLSLIIVFTQPDQTAIRQLTGFVEGGGVAILVSLQNPFPGSSSGTRQAGNNSVIHTMGRGKLIELPDGVGDPGAFSRDVRRLLGRENLPISLWNASTIIAVPYQVPNTQMAIVELLNYSADSMPVQVRIRGTYSVLRYETPERGCCETLRATHQDGFTQFEVPRLRIGGRVHLGAIPVPQNKKS